MDIYSNKNLWKLTLFITAVLIGVGTLWYTETFLKELRQEEEKNIKIWANAVQVATTATSGEDLSFATSYITNNNTIPVILTDEEGNIITSRNLKKGRENDADYLKTQMLAMAEENDPIEIVYDQDKKNYLYYKESILLTKLRVYPMVLLGVIGLFVGIAYLAFSASRRAEQNRVWTGMAKETAHQIGTPLSSLMGWIEILRTQNTDESMLVEMENDINRLTVITDRFSKIGSQPTLQSENLKDLVEQSVTYFEKRISKKIKLSFKVEEGGFYQVVMNPQLMGWVVENLIRNSVDAIEGPGEINLYLSQHGKNIRLDVEDSGKGIPYRQMQAVFRPGFTTKTRGWGLGLSLAKRIVENYHNGKIFVAKSEVGTGTTFRISLPRITQ
ncbi:MAG: HAMP domain-containing sensor histidine kinase [Schleiferiaceae bacterium]